MSKTMLYSSIGVWFALVALFVVLSVATGVHLTLAIGVLVLVVGVVPPAIVYRLFGGSETQSVAEMLRR